MNAKELQVSQVPTGYKTNVLEFFIPIILLLGIAVGTFIFMGSPKVNWAFGIALLVSVFVALIKGMRLGDVIEGIGDGLKGVVFGSVILVLAVTIGSISREVGAGSYLVALLGDKISYIALPVALQGTHDDHRLLDRDQLGNVCDCLPARHATRMERGSGQRSRKPDAVHVGVFRHSFKRECVWRSVFTNF